MGFGLLASVIIAVAGAWVLWRLQQVALLRWPTGVERRPAPLRPHRAVDDALAPFEAELTRLGFVFSHAADVRATPRGLGPWQPLRIWRHRQLPMLAQLEPPPDPARPNLPRLSLFGQVHEGLVVATTNQPGAPFPAEPRWLRLAGDAYVSVTAQYEDQWASMQAEGLPDFLPWGDAAEIEARLAEHENRVLEMWRSEGWCRLDGDMQCVSPRRLPAVLMRQLAALRRFEAALREAEPNAAGLKRNTPLERAVAMFVAAKARPKAAAIAPLQWALFGGGVLLGLLCVALTWGASHAWMLLAVLALHHGARYATLWTFGLHRTRVSMSPLGGPGLDPASRAGPRRRALLALAGPGPGLLVGAVLWALVDDGSALQQLAWWLLIVNGLCWLPLPSLAGAHLLAAVLPSRRARWRWAVEVAATAGLFGWCWAVGLPVGAALAIVATAALLRWPAMWWQLRLQRAVYLAARRAQPTDAGALARLAFQQLERALPTRVPLAWRLPCVDRLLTALKRRPRLPRGRAWALAAAYLALLLPLCVLAPSLRSAAEAGLLDGARRASGADSLDRDIAPQDITQLALRLDRRPGVQGASEPALAALAQRSGAELPADVRALYSARDGLDLGASLTLLPVADVQPLRHNRPRLGGQLTQRLRELRPGQPAHLDAMCAPGTPGTCPQRLAQVLSWLQLGSVQGRPLLLYPQRTAERWRLVSLDTEQGRLLEEPDVRQLLTAEYVAARAASSAQTGAAEPR
ncbi:M50 family metallopeptidase [Caldimonas brevitalea]|uniref:Uncharacterized protein n=1 Tax=Caldimonas brevitalea TaxID=413882 RepID=A0A0G3BMA1_9BURK|nr:M50 family metallopeptidase [Caldimonas brevitalea]AKJ27685.1 hypothetical protein AAW51_0994 [Caldimonas brevitalea]